MPDTALNQRSGSAPTGFIHCVYFWLRDGGTAEDARAIADGIHQHLTGIPGILRLAVGRPAGTPRDVVDNSFAVSLLLEFADRGAHDAYQEHPDHQAFIAQRGQHWARVQVYDALLGPA